MITLTALKILHFTHDIPQIHHDEPPFQRNITQCTQNAPNAFIIIPTALKISCCTAHTLPGMVTSPDDKSKIASGFYANNAVLVLFE